MATLTIDLPDDQHLRLKQLAASKGISVNQLIQELSTKVLAECDARNRFNHMEQKGNIQEGLDLLDKLDSLLSS
ncbi:MAG: toxin-antitoxin system HicB family antitoxin [Microcystaceae cyanobacterium]